MQVRGILCVGIGLVMVISCTNQPTKKTVADQFELGLYYMQAGKEVEAKRALIAAFQADQEFVRKIDQLFTTGQCLSTQENQRWIETNQKFKMICNRFPYFKAANDERKANYQQAIHHYDQILEINPLYKPALEGMKRCYEKIGDFKKAEAIRRYCHLLPEPELGVRDEDNRFYADGHIAYERIEPESRRRLRELRNQFREQSNDIHNVNDTIRY